MGRVTLPACRLQLVIAQKISNRLREIPYFRFLRSKRTKKLNLGDVLFFLKRIPLLERSMENQALDQLLASWHSNGLPFRVTRRIFPPIETLQSIDRAARIPEVDICLDFGFVRGRAAYVS